MANILVVDDETRVRQVLSILLSQRGHRPVEAADGSQALALFHAERPDLVIADIVMPAMDGFEFIRRMRADRLGKTLPVIIHTAFFFDEKARVLAQECGVQTVLEKPTPVALILEAVDKCLNSPPALLEQTLLAEAFEREHLQLVTNKLVEKVRELETVNRRLEQEVAERKRSELALQASQARLASVVESATDAIISIDENQRIVLFNSAAETMFHCRTVEALGQPIERFIPRFRAAHEDHVRRLAPTGTNRRLGELGAVHGRRADGNEFPIEASISPGNVGGRKLFTVILRDITDRKKAEEALRDTAERLRVVSRKVIEIQENERRHLARELHDEIGQVLCAISVNLKVVKGKVDPESWPRLEESAGMVDRAIQQVRDLSLDLRPSMLDDVGLEAALRWYVDRVAERSALTARFTAESSLLALPHVVRNVCFRVVQEALTNVVRHSRAREVQVTFQAQQEEVRLIIQDDGNGFDVAMAQQRASRDGSLGLVGMQERVTLLGGNLDIESHPERGTIIRVRLPLAEHATSAEANQGPESL